METAYVITSDGELYHWGVKGMKWGVRRYQRADGSLTPAGRKRRAAKSPEELMDKIAKSRSKTAELGRTAATLALTGGVTLGVNALTAATMGVIELKTTAIGIISAGASAVTGAMAAIEKVKVAAYESQLRQVDIED